MNYACVFVIYRFIYMWFLFRIFIDWFLFPVIKIVKYLRLFASSWAYIHLPFFQIHEKLHHYEKQNPVPILHGAAALADDVSVPVWDHRGRSSTSMASAELTLVQTEARDSMSENLKKLQMFPKDLSSQSLHWYYADFHSPVIKILHVDTVLFCLGNYVIEILV